MLRDYNDVLRVNLILLKAKVAHNLEVNLVASVVEHINSARWAHARERLLSAHYALHARGEAHGRGFLQIPTERVWRGVDHIEIRVRVVRLVDDRPC